MISFDYLFFVLKTKNDNLTNCSFLLPIPTLIEQHFKSIIQIRFSKKSERIVLISEDIKLNLREDVKVKLIIMPENV